VQNAAISIPTSTDDTVYDNDVLRVVQQVAERRRPRAHERDQHPEERRDLVRHVPYHGCNTDKANNGAIAKLCKGEGEGARPQLRSWSQSRSGGHGGVVVKITLAWNRIWPLFWKVMFRDRVDQAKGDAGSAGG
jgi:hypothetical protein